MGSSGPKTPSAQDTAAANKDTARYNTEMSFVDQYGPWGSYTYTKLDPPTKLQGTGKYDSDGKEIMKKVWDEDAAPRYRLDTTLSPSEQKKMEGLDAVQLGLLNTGQNMLGNVQQSMSQPIDWAKYGYGEGVARSGSGTGAGAGAGAGSGGLMGLNNGFNEQVYLKNKVLQMDGKGNGDYLPEGGWDSQNMKEYMAQFGMTPQQHYEKYGRDEGIDPGGYAVQNSLNTSGIPGYQYGVDTSGLPGMTTSVNMSGKPDYQYNIDMSGAPGLVGSLNTDWTVQRDKANETALRYLSDGMDDRFNRQQSDLENQLVNQGIKRGTEAWGTAMDEYTGSRDKAYRNVADQAYLTGLNEMNTMFGMEKDAGMFQNSARNQKYNELMGMAGLNNSARGQAFGEGLANANLGNSSRNQLFSEGMANAQLNNSSRGQAFGEQLAAGNFFNQAQGQKLAQDQGIGNYYNNLRNQSLQEEIYKRNMPLNDLMAMISGTQITPPQFSNVQTGQTPPQPYYQGGGGNNWTSDLLGLGGSLGSAAIMGALMMPSSRTLKRKIGECDDVLDKVQTLPIDRWRYDYDGNEDNAEHIGTYAEDWAECFGGTGTAISTIDMFGVLLKSVQELTARLERLETENERMTSYVQ